MGDVAAMRPGEAAAGPEAVSAAEDSLGPREEGTEPRRRTAMQRFLRGLTNILGGKGIPAAETYDFLPPFDLTEMKALVRFAADRGLDTDPPCVHHLGASLRKYRAQEVWDKEEVETAAAVAKQYTDLLKVTYGAQHVSGRTVLDSANLGSSAVTQAGIYFLAFFGLALLPELGLVFISEADPLAGLLFFLKKLSPFFWGGVGATVFLMKSISEIASDSRFDSRRLQGVGPRVFLGAVIGYIVVESLKVFNVVGSAEAVGGLGIDLTDSGVAFLSGLGVKAIYGVFEGIVNGVASRINGK